MVKAQQKTRVGIGGLLLLAVASVGAQVQPQSTDSLRSDSTTASPDQTSVLMQAALNRDEEAAARDAYSILVRNFRLPQVDERAYYQCARQLPAWTEAALRELVLYHFDAEGRKEAHQSQVLNWLQGIQQKCDAATTNSIASQLKSAADQLEPVRPAREKQAREFAEVQRKDRLAKEQREQEVRQAAAEERNRREEADSQVRAKAAAQAQVRRVEEERLRDERATALRTGKARIESIQDAAIARQAKSSAWLIFQPPLDRAPGVFQGFGEVVAFRDDGKYRRLGMKMGSNHFLLIYDKTTTTFLGDAGRLRVGGFVHFVGVHTGTESFNGSAFPVFAVEFLSPR